ncbi:LysR family transcriptional regulator [Sphingobium xenophagum]|nr:LysR family transcriptional regulator [Sphingobium xenophagum]
MRFERLDLNLLVALDALFDECSVSAAARRLNLSQSATSGALLRLREYFQDELLASSGSRMIRTARAEELREPVREALMFIRHRIARPPAFDPMTTIRTFHTATSDYVLDVALGPYMAMIQNEAPGISTSVTLPTFDMSDKLHRGEIDLIISVGDMLDNRHPTLPFLSDDHVVVAWEENTRLRSGLTQELFLELPHVTVHFGNSRTTAHVERHFDQLRVSRNIAITVPFFAAVPALLLGTERIATMLRRQANYYAKILPLTIYELPYQIPDLQEVIQFHTARRNDLALNWFVQGLLKFTGNKSVS